ncbi:protein of unknown function [Hyphomicrobium sp. MC1]|nr:protein of unknown function [Hyphomicrobium sp. MC1]
MTGKSCEEATDDSQQGICQISVHGWGRFNHKHLALNFGFGIAGGAAELLLTAKPSGGIRGCDRAAEFGGFLIFCSGLSTRHGKFLCCVGESSP